MEVDASDYATGGVLSMECEDGLWRLVAFLSKSLNETERNYEIHDKEMLAIIRGLENWRHLLEEMRFKFEIWTDHKNLEYFMKVQKLNRRQARWALYLSRFDFTLKHVPGTKMGKADGLSRRSDWKIGVDKDNENQTLIKDNWIRSLGEVVIEGPEVDIIEKIKKEPIREGMIFVKHNLCLSLPISLALDERKEGVYRDRVIYPSKNAGRKEKNHPD